MVWSARDSSRVVLRSSCTWNKDKRFVLSSKLYKRMSMQREVFHEDLNNANHTKKSMDFREGLAWSPLPNG
jgi:hypothetical protein